MTTEEKALALDMAQKARRFCTSSTLGDVICRDLADELERAIEREQTAIEAHEADKKAFSDAVKRFFEINMMPDSYRDCLSSFILPEPEPDPLVEALADCRGCQLDEQQVKALRNALAARGYKIERIDHD